jgi:molybdate transport system substrate-binding protein
MRLRRTMVTLVVAAAVMLGACSSDNTTVSGASSSVPTSSTRQVSGTIIVFAAASLTESFSDEQTTLKTEQPGLSVTYNFAGSGALVTQIQQGAPADVIATADAASMQKLVDGDLVEPPTTLAKNKLEILVAPGNPKKIKGLSDLGRSDITFVTEDDTVPAGKYAAQALANAGVTVSPVSKELDVKSAVAKVTTGEADATIVYVTDVAAAGSKGFGVVIPDNQNVIATYPIAIVKATTNHDAAAAFVAAAVNGSGQRALASHGFLPGS